MILDPTSRAGKDISWIYNGSSPVTLSEATALATENKNGFTDLGPGAVIHTITIEDLTPRGSYQGEIAAGEVHTPTSVKRLESGEFGIDISTGLLLIFEGILNCWTIVDRRTNSEVLYDAQLLMFTPWNTYVGDQGRTRVTFRRGDPTSFGGVYVTPRRAKIKSAEEDPEILCVDLAAPALDGSYELNTFEHNNYPTWSNASLGKIIWGNDDYPFGEDLFWTCSSAVDVSDGVNSSDRAQKPWLASYAAGTITEGVCA